MVTLSMALVIIMAILSPKYDGEISISPIAFVVTGIIDIFGATLTVAFAGPLVEVIIAFLRQCF